MKKIVLLFVITIFCYPLKAEKVFFYTPLNCENLEWFVYQNFNQYDHFIKNEEFNKEFCIIARNSCNQFMNSKEFDLKFSSTVGYAFTFEKPICDKEVDYVKATKYYLQAFEKPNNQFYDLSYFNKIIVNLIWDASTEAINIKDLLTILEMYQYANLKYTKEDKEFRYGYRNVSEVLEDLDYGKGDNWKKLDTRIIINFYKNAAECGWAQGQYDLGKSLVYGTLRAVKGARPTITNYVEGYKWLIIAKQNGYPFYDYMDQSQWKNEFDWIEKERLSPSQITEAQDRAFNWQPNCQLY